MANSASHPAQRWPHESAAHPQRCTDSHPTFARRAYARPRHAVFHRCGFPRCMAYRRCMVVGHDGIGQNSGDALAQHTGLPRTGVAALMVNLAVEYRVCRRAYRCDDAKSQSNFIARHHHDLGRTDVRIDGESARRGQHRAATRLAQHECRLCAATGFRCDWSDACGGQTHHAQRQIARIDVARAIFAMVTYSNFCPASRHTRCDEPARTRSGRT